MGKNERHVLSIHWLYRSHKAVVNMSWRHCDFTYNVSFQYGGHQCRGTWLVNGASCVKSKFWRSKGMQEKESITVVGADRKMCPSWSLFGLMMSNKWPSIIFFYPHLTAIKDSYNLFLLLRLHYHQWVFRLIPLYSALCVRLCTFEAERVGMSEWNTLLAALHCYVRREQGQLSHLNTSVIPFFPSVMSTKEVRTIDNICYHNDPKFSDR